MKKNQFAVGVVFLALVIIIGAVAYHPSTTLRPAPITPATTTDDDAVLGRADAPVTMVIFGDYQCPYCKQAFAQVESKVRTEYVDTGKVKMVFRDFPLDSIHPYARKAAAAAQCALPQGKYWEYHDELYTHQAELPTIDYVALAKTLGLDSLKFQTCLDNNDYSAEIEKDLQDGNALGVSGTPATFIAGTLIPGAYPFEAYQQTIEAALKKAQGGW